MISFDDLKQQLNSLKPSLTQLEAALDIENLTQRLKKLDTQAGDALFWEREDSQLILKEAKEIRNKLTRFSGLNLLFSDTLELISLAEEINDYSVGPDVQAAVKEITTEIDTQTLATLLTGDYDGNNAILTLHAGAGGTEAQDWVEMLYRMYTRWAEQSGYKYKVLDFQEGDEAGIKSATILIEGDNAYGYTQSESGVHRLVRISPFDSSGRRHTSFAAVEVMPEIDDAAEVDIDEKDLRIDTYRASGAGGQHVNKTDSAVRITHIPTGVVVACQNERSQRQNREQAMKMLKSRLVEIKEREHLEHIEDIKADHKEITWGSQIRSYVFMPYTLVKDHRTNHEEGNVEGVMDGNINPFIQAYLHDKSLGKLKG